MSGFDEGSLSIPDSVRMAMHVRVVRPPNSSIHFPRFAEACTCFHDYYSSCVEMAKAYEHRARQLELTSSLTQDYHRDHKGQGSDVNLKSSIVRPFPVHADPIASNDMHAEETFQGKRKTPTMEGRKKNPWGNASYSDLIADAIQSSSMKRLTLPQIYDWFVVNVPYFKDKEHLPSTKGWKNAIRHTLSLRQRFVRIPDPANPYRSWWMVATEDLRKQRRKKPRWKSRGTQTNP